MVGLFFGRFVKMWIGGVVGEVVVVGGVMIIGVFVGVGVCVRVMWEGWLFVRCCFYVGCEEKGSEGGC